GGRRLRFPQRHVGTAVRFPGELQTWRVGKLRAQLVELLCSVRRLYHRLLERELLVDDIGEAAHNDDPDHDDETDYPERDPEEAFLALVHRLQASGYGLPATHFQLPTSNST